jgi:acyl carrier protein
MDNQSMTNNEKLGLIFRQVFGLDSVSDAITRSDMPEWNSMQTINLIMAMEEAFNVEITPEDAAKMLSIGLIKEMLREKGVEMQ